MKDKKKIVMLTCMVFGVLSVTLGITYSLFTFNETGGTSKLILGDIYMHYKEKNQLSLSDAMPIDINDYITYKVNPIMQEQEIIENELSRCVTIYTDWEYEFDEGSTAETFCKGTGTSDGLAIQDWMDIQSTNSSFLKDIGYYLLDAGVILPKIENLPYFEFTISGKNTYTKEDIWYEIVLTHGDDHDTRTTRIRDDLLKFTLIEVVNGKENILVDNKSYSDLTNKKIYVDTIDADTKTEINKTYRLYMWLSDEIMIGNVNQDYTSEEWKDVFASIKVNVFGDFNKKELTYEDMYDVTDASCFTTEVINTYTHNANMTEEEINLCVTYLTNQWGPEEEGVTIDYGETYESFCRGTGTNFGDTFQQILYEDSFSEERITYFEENNIIIGTDSISITDYDASCGSDVVIPKVINGYDVTMIETWAFGEKQLTSVVIPNSLVTIDDHAFYENQLTSVIFEENSKLETIKSKAFFGQYHTIHKVTIPDTVTVLYCDAFNDDVIVIKRDDLVCTVNPN